MNTWSKRPAEVQAEREHDIVVGARWFGVTLSESAALLGFSTQPSLV